MPSTYLCVVCYVMLVQPGLDHAILHEYQICKWGIQY